MKRVVALVVLVGTASAQSTMIQPYQIGGCPPSTLLVQVPRSPVDRVPGAMICAQLGAGVTLTQSGNTWVFSAVSQINFADAEKPAGTIDGTNATFTLHAAPAPAASLMLMRNGLVLSAGADYTLSGSTITFLTASIPQPGDAMLAWYRH